MIVRDLAHAEPETIEHEIVETRMSLYRKLDALQHKLNPRERVRAAVQPYADRVRGAADNVRNATSSVDQTAAAGFAALAAIGVGTALAARGLRRRGRPDPITPSDIDMMGE